MTKNKIAVRRITKRGGSLAINLPIDWLKELGWKVGTDIVLCREDKEIRLYKVKSYILASGDTVEVKTK